MRKTERLEGVRGARSKAAAAKVLSLRGGQMADAEFEGMHLMLDGMRVYLRSKVGYPRLFLVPCVDGHALFLQISHGPRVWLIAERSKRVRIFRRLETALAVCQQLEAEQVNVLLKETHTLQHKPVDLQ